MDDVTCTTTTSDQLLECASAPLLTSDCSHDEDAGVGCEGVAQEISKLFF